MTDKYTIESPEIRNHENYYISSYCNEEVVALMNQAYKEGYIKCKEDIDIMMKDRDLSKEVERTCNEQHDLLLKENEELKQIIRNTKCLTCCTIIKENEWNKETIKGLEMNLQGCLDRERKILKELSDCEEENEDLKKTLNDDIEDIRIENFELKEHIVFLEDQVEELCLRDDAIRALLENGGTSKICKDIISRLGDSNQHQSQE